MREGRWQNGGMTRRLFVALVLAAAGLMVGSASAVALVPFATPSRNIGCIGDRTEVRCDIRVTEGKPPKKPRSCRFDWGSAYVITPKAGRGRGLCASDTTLPSPGQRIRIVDYGERIVFGPLVCVSRTTGLTCRNTNAHGFELSRQRIRLF